MGCMKNVLSPPLRPSTPSVTHIKQSKGTTAPAYVLTVCTHIICHAALSVIIAWWGHQLPPWEQLCCIMCGMHHSSAAAPTSNHHHLSVWRSDLSSRQGGTLSPTKTSLWIVSPCNELHLADTMCDGLLWIFIMHQRMLYQWLFPGSASQALIISLDYTWMKMRFWRY